MVVRISGELGRATAKANGFIKLLVIGDRETIMYTLEGWDCPGLRT